MRTIDADAIPATGREVRTEDSLPDARESFIAADRDHGSERFDANAGCEFVDDRIRLGE
jgi:hypothetical protein